MSAKTFLLEIVTPEKIAYSQEVESVLVPSTTGQLGILPHHTALFAKLEEGELVIKTSKGEQYLSVGGGFIEVGKIKTTILVTRAVHADELNEKAILKAKQEAEEALKRKPSPEEFQTAQALLRSTLADLKVIQRKRRRIL